MPPKEFDDTLGTTLQQEDDAEARHELLTQQRDAAVSAKEFQRAAALQDEINALEKEFGLYSKSNTIITVTTPLGERLTLKSRTDLEKEINQTTQLIQDAVKVKNFSKAQQYQDYLETSLEPKRQLLPTLAELERLLDETSEQIRQAVANKEFLEAEKLQNTRIQLQEQHDAEQQHPQPHQEKPQQQAQSQSQQSSQPELKTTNTQKATTISTIPKTQRTTTLNHIPTTTTPTTTPRRQSIASSSVKGGLGGRSVYKLRPKKPIVVEPHMSVLDVAKAIAQERNTNAALIALHNNNHNQPGYAGVMTPHHVVELVVAQNLDPATVDVADIMKVKRGVRLHQDAAGDALGNMLEHKHRYLPVLDDNEVDLVGILDIGQCLSDAIKRFRTVSKQNDAQAQEAVQQVAATTTTGPDAKNQVNPKLLALLGPVLQQAFGNSTAPSLRTLLDGKPSTIVSSNTSVYDASVAMATDDKAALVVEHGQLLGIVTVKDVMEKAVAREMSMEYTAVYDIMTANPTPVSPELTAVEALQIMHQDQVMSLPVCEEDGTVLGSVDVLDLIYGCGGAKGWRSIFDTSMERDDSSDIVSSGAKSTSKKSKKSKKRNGKSLSSLLNHQSPSSDQKSRSGSSIFSGPPQSVMTALTKKTLANADYESVVAATKGRPVYKLRPKKPIVVEPNASVLEVSQTIARGRGDAALIVLHGKKGFAGVMTPHHIVEKIVSQNIDASSVAVSAIMKTKRGVAVNDSAGDALSNMLENKHRYLPVIDDHQNGQLVGVLDIGKCLNDAIKKFKATSETNNLAAKDVVEQVASLQTGTTQVDPKLFALLGPVLEKAFGNASSPSLRNLLAGQPSTIVPPTMSIRDTAGFMARDDKAALVVEHDQLIGIVTVKDVMEKAVAQELSMEYTPVHDIMTYDPTPVHPDITAVEALQIMHQEQVMSLPVCEEDGTVLGSVDVMDLIYGCGGAEGWRSIFDTSMDADDQSDAASSLSAGVSATKTTGQTQPYVSRQVRKLRPKRPVVAAPGESVLTVAQVIAKARGDAALIRLDNQPGYAGVVTPHHVCEKVLAKRLDPSEIPISDVMKTKRAVRMNDSAGDALSNMLENRHRYLPVMDDRGTLVGILDIGQCLADAIAKLEQKEEANSKATLDVLAHVDSKLQALLGPVLQSAFGDSASPKLGALLDGKPSNIVSPSASVEEATILIAENDKAALVVEDGQLIGMVTVKDLMEMAVAKELDPAQATVSEIMVTYPPFVSPEMTCLEALQVMQQDRVSSLPVCDDEGVLGSVDVLDLIYGCGGASGWKSIFDSSMETNDNASDHGTTYTPTSNATKPSLSPSKTASTTIPPVPENIEAPEAKTEAQNSAIPDDINIPKKGSASVDATKTSPMAFKVTYPNSTIRRFRCQPNLAALREVLGNVQLTFVDEDGDCITITSDEDLAEAINQAGSGSGGSGAIKLSIKESSLSSWWNSLW